MKSLQLIYRSTVMIGTLVVGALAYRAYGPQLEKLTPIFDRARQLIAETWQGDAAPPVAESDEATAPPAPFLPGGDMEPISPNYQDSGVRKVGFDQDGSTPRLPPQPSPVAVVVRELSDRGVSDYALTKWGDSGRFYRFRCSLPWAGGVGSSMQFEAISDDPASAAQQVLTQVDQWQVAHRPASPSP